MKSTHPDNNQTSTIRFAMVLFVTGLMAVLLFMMSACGGSPGEATTSAPVAATTQTASASTADTATETPDQSNEVLPTATAESSSETAVDTTAGGSVDEIPVENVKLELVPIISGLAQPLFVTNAGDGSGRLFIVEKVGTIRIVQDGKLLAEPFLDIRDLVTSDGSEQGLLGLAFAPDFSDTGHFFVNYTGKDVKTHVDRYMVNADAPDSADVGSRFAILEFAQPAGNHNGGMLAFGPDGMLYIGTGDGGASFDRFGNGQNPATLLGKMLRIDVTSDPSVAYTIPADNPWVDEGLNGADVLDEIWAIGLRNPWRYSFDRSTGDLWIADVGQNQYEEVNLIPAGTAGGLNFGWPIQEATHCLQEPCDSAAFVQPVIEYSHDGGNCSITGGYVYRGTQFAGLDGVYFYGDYCSGAIWAARTTDNGVQTARIDRAAAQISSFGEDEQGELYLADLNGGVVYHLILAE
ncbi:MAG: PQQ-dependent sugar dehydrogenase [Caldilineaceae bacterium]